MSRYLVTGGAGFIGSHLVEGLLAAGHGVRVLDDLSTGKRENLGNEVELVVASVVDRKAVRSAMEECDGAFHLAAIASVAKCNEDWAGAHQVNLTGTINVFEAAGIRPVVYASSAAVFGDTPDMPLSETSRTAPLSAYGADKLGCEQHARAGAIVHGLPSTGLRFFNVYGPRQDPSSPYSGVISIFANRLMAGQDVTVFGDGEQTRDFVYVGDVVQALIRSMDSTTRGARVFNVCTGRSTSLLQLIDTIGGILGGKSGTSFAPARDGDIRNSLGDPALMQTTLGFGPEVPLAEGLGRLLAQKG